MSEYVYITDGSLEGLLCAIHEMYYSTDDVCDILHRPPVQQDFAVQYKNIKTDAAKANKVYSAIITKISHRAAEEMTYTWLSELPFCGRNIARYIKLGFKVGYKVDFMVSDENVLPVHKAASKVRMEVHRLTGLCRFAKTAQGFYVCNISPRPQCSYIAGSAFCGTYARHVLGHMRHCPRHMRCIRQTKLVCDPFSAAKRHGL